jgi:hydroxyacylglutathione hydrolase
MIPTLQIIPIPAFMDNYIWLLYQGNQAIVVDPGDADVVMATLESLQLSLCAILITHHHSDHIDGVEALQSAYPNAKVYAPLHEDFAFTHIDVTENDLIKIQLDSTVNMPALAFNVLDLPGHTLGHVAYLLSSANNEYLFCGDTMFGAGCGRLFEGSPTQMLNSLKKLAVLPTQTSIYCTHEYTLKNIDFALTLEPNNKQLRARKEETIKLRAQHKPSLPSTIALERATNPFLRCDEPAIKGSVNLENASELETFTHIRKLRNTY